MSIKLEHNDWTWRNGHEPIPSVVLSASNLTSANGQYGARLFSAMGTLHLKQERSLNWVWHLRTVWISGRATNSSATTNYSLRFRQTGRWSDRGWLWRCRLQNDKAIWRERHSLMTFISWRWWMCYRGRWWSGEGTCGGPCCYRYQWWSRWETYWSPLWDVEGGGMAVRELGDSCQEDLAQPSCEMEGHLCAEEEQAGLGSSFVGFDWYQCQWGKDKSQQNPPLCLGSRSCFMRQVVALRTHSSQREDPGEVRLHVSRMYSFASIYPGYDRLPLCHAGAREKVCPAGAVSLTDKRAKSTLSAVSQDVFGWLNSSISSTI